MKTDASTILDRLREALQLSKDVQLAEFLGVSAQAIYQARKKDKVPDGWLIRAAQLKHISIDALLGLTSPTAVQPTVQVVTQAGVQIETQATAPTLESTGAPLNSQREEAAVSASASSNSPSLYNDEEESFAAQFCTVPLVAAKLSAGGGSLETEGLVLQRMAFRREWLQRRGRVEKMVLMRVHGDSMEPYIQDGDLALIDTSQKNIIPYAVYAVGVDDGIYVKAVETLPGQRLILRSFNERYSPMDIDMRGDLADSVRIIGKVLWWCHEV